MKLLFLTNYPAPYRVHFFNELGKKCDLTVAFEERAEEQTHRHKDWFNLDFHNFRAIYLKNIKIGSTKRRDTYTVFCPSIRKIIKNGNFDHIILGGYATFTAMYAIQYMQWKKIPYWIEIDGGIVAKRNCLIHALQKHLISHAEGYFSPSCKADEYLVSIGASSPKIHRYPFSSLANTEIMTESPSLSAKNNLRQKLGMKEDKIVVAVGRFDYGKGFDVLLKACKYLDKSIGIYIIGDKPNTEYLNLKRDNDLNNQVHFIDFKKDNALREYYQAADLFCLPTRYDVWGLVIAEAMANGLAIITTDQCVAGLELVDEQNGAIIPINDSYILATKIKDILQSDKLPLMSKISLQKIRKYTYENMVNEHLKVLK